MGNEQLLHYLHHKFDKNRKWQLQSLEIERQKQESKMNFIRKTISPLKDGQKPQKPSSILDSLAVRSSSFLMKRVPANDITSEIDIKSKYEQGSIKRSLNQSMEIFKNRYDDDRTHISDANVSTFNEQFAVRNQTKSVSKNSLKSHTVKKESSRRESKMEDTLYEPLQKFQQLQ